MAAGAQDVGEQRDDGLDTRVIVVDEDRAGNDDGGFLADDVVDEFGEVEPVGTHVSDVDAGTRGALGEAVEHGLRCVDGEDDVPGLFEGDRQAPVSAPEIDDEVARFGVVVDLRGLGFAECPPFGRVDRERMDTVAAVLPVPLPRGDDVVESDVHDDCSSRNVG